MVLLLLVLFVVGVVVDDDEDTDGDGIPDDGAFFWSLSSAVESNCD